MRKLHPAELSALLDGELDPVRAGEVEALIVADAKVRGDYEHLKRADRMLKAVVQSGAFRQEVRWTRAFPVQKAAQIWPALGGGVILLAWVGAKLAPTMFTALAINAASLALLIAWLAPFALREAGAGANAQALANGDLLR
jgi:anti-sigma factor RsiW